MRFTEKQKERVRHMRARCSTWQEIAKEMKVSERTLQRHFKGTVKPRQNSVKLTDNLSVDTVKTGERVKNMLVMDVERSAQALNQLEIDVTELKEWQKREQIAESIQKRANSLLNIGETNEPIINIAVMSQLPDEPKLCNTTTYEDVSSVTD